MVVVLLLPLTSSPSGGRGFRRGTRKGRQRSKGQGCQEICHPGRPPPKVPHLEVGGVRGAGEQVTGGVVTYAAGGTGWVSGRADPRSVGVEESAIAGAELGQGSAVGSGKGKLFPLDRGRGGLEDGVWCKLADGSLHRRGMKVRQRCSV